MKILPFILLVYSACLTSCVVMDPAGQKSYLAPVRSLEDITNSVIHHRIIHDRWPQNRSELRGALAGITPGSEYIEEIKDVTILAQDPASVKYRIDFIGGGSSEMEFNINKRR